MGLWNTNKPCGEPVPGSILVEAITNADDFLKLEQTWNNLLVSSNSEPACMQWKWMQLWWLHYATPAFKPLILLFHKDDTLIGIFPLVIIPRKRRGLVEQTLYFLGTGEDEKEEITTEYIDIITLPGYEQATAGAAAYYLNHVFTQWERMELMRYLKTSSLETYFLPALTQAGIRHFHIISGYRHFVQLKHDYDSYVSQRSSSFRKNLKTHKNRLYSLGEVEIIKVASAEQIDHALNILRELHLRRFDKLSKTSAFISQRFTDYHRDFMHWLNTQNQLLFKMLFLNGKAIAAEYNFIINKKVYAYQGSFDPDIKRMSLGFISINEMIKEAIEQGASIYDFMMGSEDHYASIYGCEREQIHTCYVYNRSIKNRLAFYWGISKKRSRSLRIRLKEVWFIMKLIM